MISPRVCENALSIISDMGIRSDRVGYTDGKITLDLGGFTIQEVGVLNSGVAIQNPTNSIVIVRNGTIEDFFEGVVANPAAAGWISNVRVENVSFLGEKRAGVFFNQVNGSSVSNCALGEIEKAARERNLLTHSVWIDEQEKIVMLNYSDYHESKWMLIDENGKRKTPQASPRRTLEELQTFAAHLHDL